VYQNENRRARSSPKWSNRQVVYATLFVLLVLASFFLLYRFSRIVFILFIAIVLGTAIRPAVEWLYQRGTPFWGVILVYVLLVLLMVGVGVASYPCSPNRPRRSLQIYRFITMISRTAVIQSSSRICSKSRYSPADLSFISPDFHRELPRIRTWWLNRFITSTFSPGVC
jgi:hypothetical protein